MLLLTLRCSLHWRAGAHLPRTQVPWSVGSERLTSSRCSYGSMTYPCHPERQRRISFASRYYDRNEILRSQQAVAHIVPVSFDRMTYHFENHSSLRSFHSGFIDSMRAIFLALN